MGYFDNFEIKGTLLIAIVSNLPSRMRQRVCDLWSFPTH